MFFLSGRLRQVLLYVPVTEILILCESATTSAGYSIGISCTNCCPGFVEISTGMFFSLGSPLGYKHKLNKIVGNEKMHSIHRFIYKKSE